MNKNKCGVMWKAGDGWHQCLKLRGHKDGHAKVGKHACAPGPNDKIFRKAAGGRPGESRVVEIEPVTE